MENKYVSVFDKNKNFKEIRIMDELKPFVVNLDSKGDLVYIFTQKEFKKLIESAMRYLTEPTEADDSDTNENVDFSNMGQQVVLPNGDIGYIKSISTTDNTSGSNPQLKAGDYWKKWRD